MEEVAAPGGATLALLGGWQLAVNGRQTIAPAYEKGRALLAYLALEPRWHARDALACLFWPDSTSHRANLRQVLANLRAVLGDTDAASPCLQVRRDAISIEPDCADRVDVAAFLASPPRCDGAGSPERCRPCLQRMEAAEHLYRGDFMAGFSLPDCPEFEEWLRRRRESLRRHAVELCGRLADCHERYGDREQAQGFARRAVDLDPWDEAAQRRLMRLLAAGGQAAAALRQFEALEVAMHRDLGVPPEETTRALHREIRAGALQPSAIEATPEIRRVVVLLAEPDLGADAELLEPGRQSPLADVLDMALARWNGKRFPTTGFSLGAVFGLANDGEQGPRRALMAALELAAHPEFATVRIGICEGRALIGARPGESIAAGMLPALAQRLALCGEPGDVVTTASLAGEIGPAIPAENLPPRRFTGLAGEHHPCRLGRSTRRAYVPYPARFTAPFVGRTLEQRRLRDALAEAGRTGRSRFVEIEGLPGAGKSRLLAELANEHGADGGEVRWIRHRPELRYIPLGGLRESLRERIGACGLPTAEDGHRLDEWLAHGFPAEEQWALRAPLRALLALDGEPAATASNVSEALLALLFAPPRRTPPVLLVFDDLHWADEATRDLLATAMQIAIETPVLAVLANRPAAGIAPPGASARERIALQPLAHAESLALIAAIDEAGHIDDAQRARLAKMSGGLPLHTEYIARTAREQPVSAASLFGVLQGVLDRLGPHRAVLQVAAVFGTGFRGAALHALLPAASIAEALEHAEDLAVSRRLGEDAYVFRHALLRDCAYESLPPPQRRHWHRQAAAWLAQRPETPASDIALHYESAEAWPEAQAFWARAAETAYLDEFAGEAKEAAIKALTIASKGYGVLTEPLQAELELLAGYAALMAQGYGAKEAQRFFAPTAARTAGEIPDETLFRALTGMAAAIPQGRKETLAIMDRLDDMARTPAHRMMVCYGFGSLHFWRGDFATSLARIDEAVRIAENIPAREWLRYSADCPAVACRALKGINLAFSGTPEAARRAAAEAVERARSGGRAHGLCFALTMAASVHLVLDDPAGVERFATEGLELAARRRFSLWHAYNTLFGMWAKARRGRLRLSASFKLMSMHREFAAASRLSPVTSLWFAALIFEALDRWSLSDIVARKAIALADNGGDRYCVADLMRLRALARHARGDGRGAGRWLDQAREQARTLGADGILLRIEQTAARIAAR